MYTCTFQIAPIALPGSYKLVNDNTVAFDPVGAKLAPVTGVDGVVAVSLVIIPTPTATPIPTSTPSEATRQAEGSKLKASLLKVRSLPVAATLAPDAASVTLM